MTASPSHSEAVDTMHEGRQWAARGFALLAEYHADEHGPYDDWADALRDVVPADVPEWLRADALRLLRGSGARQA